MNLLDVLIKKREEQRGAVLVCAYKCIEEVAKGREIDITAAKDFVDRSLLAWDRDSAGCDLRNWGLIPNELIDTLKDNSKLGIVLHGMDNLKSACDEYEETCGFVAELQSLIKDSEQLKAISKTLNYVRDIFGPRFQ